MKRMNLFCMLAVGVLGASVALAEEVTLTGTMVCGKCKLHVTKECQNVLEVPNGGTNIDYFLTQNKVSKDFHDTICTTDGEQVTVTGKVKAKHGQEILTATSITPVSSSPTK